MVGGINASAASLVSLQTRMMQLANNIANVDTPGYKQDVIDAPEPGASNGLSYRLAASTGRLQGAPVGVLPASVLTPEPPDLDLSQGILKQTGRPLDMAINGAGYFVVQKPDGLYYTRDGSFSVAPDGQLVTSDGGLVLGALGPITLSAGEVTVDEAGNVSVDGQPVDRLRLEDFGPETVMQKVGGNYLRPQDAAVPGVPATGAIHQGFLENSNVDVSKTMVEMMSLMRSYQASQRMLQLQGQALSKAVNDVGRLA